MQAKQRFILLWLIVLFILIMCLLNKSQNSNTLYNLTNNIDDFENLPSFMDDWQQNLEIGRAPAAKTYEARQKMPHRISYRKTNKNCRFNYNYCYNTHTHIYIIINNNKKIKIFFIF